MHHLLTRRPSPAMGVAVIALFVSLGGVSYGVATGSIDSREIKNNTVRGKDIRNSTVQSKDVRNRSLLARDFKDGQLPAGPRGATGPSGAKGATGDQGDQGPPGAPGQDGADGVTGYVDATTGNFNASVAANATTGSIFATCPAGTRAVGGGFNIVNTDAGVVEDFKVLVSQRGPSQAQWQVIVRNTDDTQARTLIANVTAVCVQGP